MVVVPVNFPTEVIYPPLYVPPIFPHTFLNVCVCECVCVRVCMCVFVWFRQDISPLAKLSTLHINACMRACANAHMLDGKQRNKMHFAHTHAHTRTERQREGPYLTSVGGLRVSPTSIYIYIHTLYVYIYIYVYIYTHTRTTGSVLVGCLYSYA